MSGRVRVTLADGRRVTGYRKTLNQRGPRTPAHQLPDWRLSIYLPSSISFAIPLGPYAPVLGVDIHEGGRAEISGKVRSWVEAVAARFIRDIAPYGQPLRIVLERGDEPGPTDSGPIRKGEVLPGTLTIEQGQVRLVIGSNMRSLSPVYAPPAARR